MAGLNLEAPENSVFSFGSALGNLVSTPASPSRLLTGVPSNSPFPLMSMPPTGTVGNISRLPQTPTGDKRNMAAFSSGLLPSVGLATLEKLKPVPIVERVEPNTEAEWFGCRRSRCRGRIHESVLRRESAFFCRTKPIQPGGKSQRRHPGIRTRRLDVRALCAAAVSGLSAGACTGVPVSVEAVKANSQSLVRSSVIDTAWGSLVVEIGYTFTGSLEDCRNHMLKVGGRKISAQDVSKIISSLSESPPALTLDVNFEIWLRYDSRSETHNNRRQFRDAVLGDMASRHRVQGHSVQIIKVESVEASENRRQAVSRLQRYHHKRYRNLLPVNCAVDAVRVPTVYSTFV
ncbi:ccr4-not transcription complex [Culex quinquefasciatus]|uniref:Ccr4-not transcription complex n=1 Tax=Culex quinquefasciatus TaxID=7176 RepID=B0WX74_CULQU|nr:ccr4-not transcription complex [Culex quinquefasciatus]|eukprot:XP_001861996.1 ccr4-not transcription complex [Culex quinquefasciatus]